MKLEPHVVYSKEDGKGLSPAPKEGEILDENDTPEKPRNETPHDGSTMQGEWIDVKKRKEKEGRQY